eukprot:2455708-Pleurochrysis_carterae.AAC.1
MHYLWSRNYADVFTEILDSSPDIAEFLDQRTTNVFDSRLNADLESDVRGGRRFNFVGGLLVRNRNVHFFPKHRLLLAIQSKHKQ